MDFPKTVREQDLISLMLVALALASLAAAAVPGARPVGLAIPDHLLERVRGTNPMTIQQSEGSCTGINVNTANSPPAPNPPYVDGNGGCAISGQPCIVCLLGVNSFVPAQGNGAIKVKMALGTLCNNPGSGSGQLGSCQLVGGSLMCNTTGTYDCQNHCKLLSSSVSQQIPARKL